MIDPIIAELHRFREEAYAEVDFDPHRFCERLREHEKLSQHVIKTPAQPATPLASKE